MPTLQTGGNLRQHRRLSFNGYGGDLFGIFLLNGFLTLLTLGIYSFWGKVRVRRYIWNATEFDGEPFFYRGTGKELLFGFLKALLFFGLPLTFLNILPRLFPPHPFLIVIQVLIYGLITLFVPVAMVGARRYRLNRTSWREILFSFRGQTWEFVKLFLHGSFLTLITLGLYYPFFATRRYGFMVSHSYFGNQKFHFEGSGRDLFKPFLFAWLLLIPTLGLYWFWFLAEKERYFWKHTSFMRIRFRSTVMGGRLLALHLGNLLLLLFTMGVAGPWILVRKIRFTLSFLTLEGQLDPATISQDAREASATGEGLAGLMDADFDIG